MYLSSLARGALRVCTAVMFLFLYAPLALVAVLSFNKARSFAWPPTGFTTHWWSRAFEAEGPA